MLITPCATLMVSGYNLLTQNNFLGTKYERSLLQSATVDQHTETDESDLETSPAMAKDNIHNDIKKENTTLGELESATRSVEKISNTISTLFFKKPPRPRSFFEKLLIPKYEIHVKPPPTLTV